MTDRPTTEVRLRSYVDADGPRPECFSVHNVEADRSALKAGQVRYRVLAFGLNSGMANRMGAGAPASGGTMEIGEVPKSEAILEVIESHSDGFAVGDRALRRWAPWRNAGIAATDDLLPIAPADQNLDGKTHLTILGHVGFTAYVGLVTIGGLGPGDTVFISAGAGGVGNSAIQIAKALGARVIASAGSDMKVDLMRDLGADVALNYKAAPLEAQINDCGMPFNTYFDLAGGEALRAAIETIQQNGRIIICGRASQYSGSAADAGIPNYTRMIYKELVMKGFASPLHEDVLPEFTERAGNWLRQGKLRPVATVRKGIDALPQAFADMINGENTGRMLVCVDPGGERA